MPLLQSLQNSNVVNKIHYDIEEKDTIKIESLQSLINKVIHHLLREEEGRSKKRRSYSFFIFNRYSSYSRRFLFRSI